jgi:hypothetical protein
MTKLDENTTLEQLRMYLSDAEQRAETLNWIKTAVSKHDDVNGLVLYLKAKNWDVEALEKLDFDGAEKQRKLELKINRSINHGKNGIVYDFTGQNFYALIPFFITWTRCIGSCGRYYDKHRLLPGTHTGSHGIV